MTIGEQIDGVLAMWTGRGEAFGKKGGVVIAEKVEIGLDKRCVYYFIWGNRVVVVGGRNFVYGYSGHHCFISIL